MAALIRAGNRWQYDPHSSFLMMVILIAGFVNFARGKASYGSNIIPSSCTRPADKDPWCRPCPCLLCCCSNFTIILICWMMRSTLFWLRRCSWNALLNRFPEPQMQLITFPLLVVFSWVRFLLLDIWVGGFWFKVDNFFLKLSQEWKPFSCECYWKHVTTTE